MRPYMKRRSFGDAPGQTPLLFSQRALDPYSPSQFCCLRLLAGLLHIPQRRSSKEAAVFAAELRATGIPNVISRARRIHRVGQHEPSSLLQAKVLLILKGGHVGECLEMVV